MSQKGHYPNRQAESAVPRPPPRVITAEEVQELIEELQNLRQEFVTVQSPFPPGHHLIRLALGHFPDLTLAQFTTLLNESRSLRTSVLGAQGRRSRETAQEFCIWFDRIERARNRIRRDLAEIRSELEKEKYNHLRRNQTEARPARDQTESIADRHRMSVIQDQIEAGPARDQIEAGVNRHPILGGARQLQNEANRDQTKAGSSHHMRTSARYLPPPFAAYRRNPPSPEPARRQNPEAPTYEELLLENRRLLRENQRLGRALRDAKEELDDAEELQTQYKSHIENLEWMYNHEKKKNEERGKEDEDEEEEE